eukprot:TRINITY_DN42510_c0_g1_i1.p1 TRINITY_DN42510_c0_g1~~TRINITY_DN42510_c0_g1_i1.p1  ORF type:complete len:254 (+),score=70.29 TRINITY_DN42510_c0_g1_i1:58-762(+)
MAENKSVTLARVAERVERFDDMAQFMKERVEENTPLSAEERDMLSAAFKNALTERRQAIRVTVSVENQKRAEGQEEPANLASGYKTKVESELQGICNQVLSLLSTYLLPAAEPGQDKTFYLKMQGDYYRYLSEFAEDAQREGFAQHARQAYTDGMTEAQSLDPAHPVRLGLALNFAVFQHEVLQETQQAIETAELTHQAAYAALQAGNTDEETAADAMQTMALLSDNLKLWTHS